MGLRLNGNLCFENIYIEGTGSVIGFNLDFLLAMKLHCTSMACP